MLVRQAVITEPFHAAVREVDLPPPAPNQVLVETAVSAVSAGTELAVYTGTHQWLKDPNLPDWKFPFRSGYRPQVWFWRWVPPCPIGVLETGSATLATMPPTNY